jgi:hypothetical protein
MPFPYTIDTERRFAHIKVSGSVRGAEVAETILALFADAQWHPGFNALWDGREITELILEPGDQNGFVDLMIKNASRAGTGIDVVLVVRALDVAMANLYSALAHRGPRQAQVFESEHQAMAALGISSS